MIAAPFDAIIEDCQLTDAALLRMAMAIDAADTGHPEADPLAACTFRMKNFKKQLQVHETLYAWCRPDVSRSTT